VVSSEFISAAVEVVKAASFWVFTSNLTVFKYFFVVFRGDSRVEFFIFLLRL